VDYIALDPIHSGKDATQAIDDVLNRAQTEGKKAYIRKASSPYIYSGPRRAVNCQLAGDDAGNSVIEFTHPNAGFYFPVTQPRGQFVRIEGLTFHGGWEPTLWNANRTAVHIDGSSMVREVTSGYQEHMDCGNLVEMSTRSGVIEGVEYTGQWGKAQVIQSLAQVLTRDTYAVGVETTDGVRGNGFTVCGRGIPVNVDFDNCRANNWENALRHPDYSEGIYLKSCNLGFCDNVINTSHGPDSLIPARSCTVFDLQVVGGHLNGYQHVILADRVLAWQVVNVFVLLSRRFHGGQLTAFKFLGGENLTISGGAWREADHPVPDSSSVALMLSNIQKCRINNLTVDGFDWGANLWNDALDNIFESVQFKNRNPLAVWDGTMAKNGKRNTYRACVGQIGMNTGAGHLVSA
jgi:hypothetical protein